MKKLIFTLAALLMAGTAMADRVVTFNPETDELEWVDQIVDEDGLIQNIYEMSKDGVTIRLTQSGDDEVQDEGSWSFWSAETLTIISDLYGEHEGVPSAEALYGGISEIEITLSCWTYLLLHMLIMNHFQMVYTIATSSVMLVTCLN